MAVTLNLTDNPVHLVAYRADGKGMHQDAPDIPSGKARYVNQDHFKDWDWVILLAFETGGKYPPAVGVTQTTNGVSLGLTIGGAGGSVGVTTDVEYSQPFTGATIGAHDLYALTLDESDPTGMTVDLGPSSQGYSNDQLMGW